MDVQQWLAATTDRAPPDQLDNHERPEPFLPAPQEEKERRAGRNYRRKRHRAPSDSSFIAPAPTNHVRRQAASRSLRSERVRQADSAGESSCHASRSSSVQHAPEKSYERRPRHKTRPDRYQPKAKKRPKEGDAHNHETRKKKKRKSHHDGDGGRTAGLVQSFQLKNGPKNSRLTMKPDTAAGLFKHGRASVQVSGRGSGLPDLAFNEMRFLQRPTEHQDAPRKEEAANQKRKKDHDRPSPEDISNYFSGKKTAPNDTAKRSETHLNRHTGENIKPVSHQETTRRRDTTPPVELPSKPFLGFGSKGGIPNTNSLQSEHRTTPLPWSQSPLREPRTKAPELHVGKSAIREASADQVDPAQVRRSRENNGYREQRQRPRPPNPQRGEWVPSKRPNAPVLVQVFEQPVEGSDRRILHERRSSTKTTAQSLPRQINDAPETSKRRVYEPAQDDYHTSDILRLHCPPEDSDLAAGDCQTQNRGTEVDKENQDPASSASIDRMLGEVRRVSAISRPVKYPQPIQQYYAVKEAAQDRSPEITPDTTHRLPVRGESRSVLAPRHTGSSRQTLRQTTSYSQRVPPQISVDSLRVPDFYHSPLVEHNLSAREHDTEMLDNSPHIGSEVLYIPELNDASSRWAGEVYQGHSIHRSPGIFEAQSDIEDGQEQQYDGPSTSNVGPEQGVFVGREIESNPAIGPASGGAADNGMKGFWRPNRLY